MTYRNIKFSFDGFHRIKSACHIRLATDNAKLVVVCSQYKNYYGTSVTNAVEIIAAKLLNGIWEGEYDDPSVSWSNIVKTLAGEVKADSRKGWKENLGEKVRRIISSRTDVSNDFLLPIRNPNFFWIERYPIGTGLAGHREQYSRVTFGAGLEPSWGPTLSISEIESITGFPEETLMAPVNELDFAGI